MALFLTHSLHESREISRPMQRFANRKSDRDLQAMHAKRLLSENIRSLLRGRGQTQHDLAMWCRNSDVWLSFILAGKRGVSLEDLDRIADFFGLQTYELFLPGVSHLTERRRVQRRSGLERREGHKERELRYLRMAISLPSGSHGTAAGAKTSVRAILADAETRLAPLLSPPESGRQTATPRDALKAPRARRRVSSRSDDPEA
jgi:transcriptional regulator with XRE-family HTH domain